jgi:dimethylhistidine N-methyltransferase
MIQRATTITAVDPAIARDVAAGLTDSSRHLPAYLFYDERGSALFEAITRLPEYYLTRSEQEIFQARATELAARVAGTAWVVELGAGTASKTRLLLEALLARERQLAYVAIDVSESALAAAERQLAHPGLVVRTLVGRYETALDEAARLPGRKLALFIGSSIGNYEPAEAIALLKRLRHALVAGDRLLLGADLRKDESLLLPAYADAAGVTARFNLNMLAHVNHLFGEGRLSRPTGDGRRLEHSIGDFDLGAFRHVALWNGEASRMEMHLEARRRQTVVLPALGLRLTFEAGERIHTENSYKLTQAVQEELLRAAGFEPEVAWLDERGWFAVHLARAV